MEHNLVAVSTALYGLCDDFLSIVLLVFSISNGTQSFCVRRMISHISKQKLSPPKNKKTNGHSKSNAAAVGFGNYSSVADLLRLKRSAITFFL